MIKLRKQLPLVAMLLALTVFVGKAAVQAFSTASNTMWLYDIESDDPTNPANYDEAPAGAENNCQGSGEVCVVEAPDNGGQPNLEAVTDLLEALESRSPHANITYGFFSGN
ncbi:hypothetical protein [Parapedobacter koreensis]|uniref:Uncharacterized protein n=1 Tax=Parapedobacter koreensis TaxID=332977 RepID=A0A1H7UA29_9SPHI|nr:hypothetical protein [Parapedobacter koreensis]SEL93596.1 hypothetical protein SAMN05421740_11446 [Parapedobacter koreensis]